MNVRLPEIQRLQRRLAAPGRLKSQPKRRRGQRAPVVHDLDAHPRGNHGAPVAEHRRTANPRRAVLRCPPHAGLRPQPAGAESELLRAGPVVEGGEELAPQRVHHDQAAEAGTIRGRIGEGGCVETRDPHCPSARGQRESLGGREADPETGERTRPPGRHQQGQVSDFDPRLGHHAADRGQETPRVKVRRFECLDALAGDGAVRPGHRQSDAAQRARGVERQYGPGDPRSRYGFGFQLWQGGGNPTPVTRRLPPVVPSRATG